MIGAKAIDYENVFLPFAITLESAGTFYVDYVRWQKGVFRIYRDAGIPPNADVITWAGGAATWDGDYGDATAPEGVKSFRTEGVSWVGWGVQMTNGAVDLSYTNSLADYSAYSNGYLKFWYKSAGYTWIEIQSVTDGVTNTARGATYGPTTNESGIVVWQQKIVPASNFTNIDFSHISSPFMVTDPEVDRTYSVDYARWEATP